MQKSLIELTDADFEEVKKLAALFYTPREIAMILEINTRFFIDECDVEGGPVFNAFHGGRLLSECELRTSVLKLAKSGSSPAQTMSLEMLKNSKIQMLKR